MKLIALITSLVIAILTLGCGNSSSLNQKEQNQSSLVISGEFNGVAGFAVEFNGSVIGNIGIQSAFSPYYDSAIADISPSLCQNYSSILNATIIPVVNAQNPLLSNLLTVDWPKFEYFNCKEAITKLIVQTINSANLSIYVADFEFYNPDIVYALLQAKNRGVVVKALLDQTNLNNANSMIDVLANNGIEVYISQGYSVMHDKFMVIDNHLTEMGSLNFTIDQTTQDANNILTLDSALISQTYLDRWNQIVSDNNTTNYNFPTAYAISWQNTFKYPQNKALYNVVESNPNGHPPITSTRTAGDSVKTPSALAQYAPSKIVIVHTKASETNVCPTTLQALGAKCLDNNNSKILVDLIKSATKSIKMATMELTDSAVGNALITAKSRGIDVKIVADKGNYEDGLKNNSTQLKKVADSDVEVCINGNYRILHDKYMVIDDKTVETGSYNYSTASYQSHADNFIIFYDVSTLAANYISDFDALNKEGYPLIPSKTNWCK